MLKPVAALFAACVLIAAPAAAQDYPNKPIRIVVSFGPGGGADIVGRILGQSLQEKLGQPVVIENKPGAAGTLGNELVARAEKDGYTLGIMTAGQIIAAVMNKSLRYDTATAFEPISMVGTASLIIVTRPDFPASNAKELVAHAKANPGKVSVASPGFGATQHMSAELFRQTAGIEMLHVPFRTSPEAITAVLGKQVDILFDTVLAVLGQVQSGQLKAIAVTGAGTVCDGAGRAAGDRVGRAARLQRHHLVRRVHHRRRAEAGGGKAERGAERDPQGSVGAREAQQGRRRRAGLDAGRVRQIHGG